MPPLIPVSRDIASRAAKASWESRRYDEALAKVIAGYTKLIRKAGGENDKKKGD